MFRRALIAIALTSALLTGIAATASAQPPSPPEIARRVDRGVHRAITHTDRAVRRATRHTRYRTHYAHHRVVRISHRSVRTLCNDGRVHVGRTRFTACAGHGGIRG